MNRDTNTQWSRQDFGAKRANDPSRSTELPIMGGGGRVHLRSHVTTHVLEVLLYD